MVLDKKVINVNKSRDFNILTYLIRSGSENVDRLIMYIQDKRDIQSLCTVLGVTGRKARKNNMTACLKVSKYWPVWQYYLDFGIVRNTTLNIHHFIDAIANMRNGTTKISARICLGQWLIIEGHSVLLPVFHSLVKKDVAEVCKNFYTNAYFTYEKNEEELFNFLLQVMLVFGNMVGMQYLNDYWLMGGKNSTEKVDNYILSRNSCRYIGGVIASAFNCALMAKNLEMLQYMAQTFKDIRFELPFNATNEYVEIYRKFREHNFDESVQLFSNWCTYGDENTLIKELTDHAEVGQTFSEENKISFVENAAKLGKLKLVRRLIRNFRLNGKQLSSNNNKILQSTIAKKRWKVARYLMRHFPQIRKILC